MDYEEFIELEPQTSKVAEVETKPANMNFQF